jgi:hypothetical protein
LTLHSLIQLIWPVFVVFEAMSSGCGNSQHNKTAGGEN